MAFKPERLLLLLGLALLVTTSERPAWLILPTPTDSGGAEDDALTSGVAVAKTYAKRPTVDAAPPALVDYTLASLAGIENDSAAALDAAQADAHIAATIDRRLAMRHTGLPERERRALAQAIVKEARRHDLEPVLVIAVIEVESAGYPLAVSYVGALGLMQLLPSTAEEVAGKIGLEWKGDDTLFDPIANVKLGTAYLRELADRYEGDVSVALAAYNWGPGRIDGRIRRGATVPAKYIKQVMRAYDRNTLLASTAF